MADSQEFGKGTSRFDLTQLAPNGLRRGYTTGSCATAAVKAALLRLLCKETVREVQVTLPGAEHYLLLPVDRVGLDADEVAWAEVIKDAGDDPDQTHRARISARVRRNGFGLVRFLRGSGIGLVTEPGLQIAVGEPAINPVPRRMIQQAISEVLEEGEPGFDVEISCADGEAIAQRTFNPRLGILGGISILGTTGIVEPKSLAAFKASIEIYIRVALGEEPSEIVLTPGNLGQRFARKSLNVPLKQVVQMSNFIGFSLDCVEAILTAKSSRLNRLWIAGHPGKLAKILDGVWDTHSHRSVNAVGAVCVVAESCGIDRTILEQARQSNTVEGVSEIFGNGPTAQAVWQQVEREIGERVGARLSQVGEVQVKLFKMDGTALGGDLA